MHYFAAKGTDRRHPIFWLEKLDLSNFQKICDNVISKSEIYADRSLFEALYSGRGALFSR